MRTPLLAAALAAAAGCSPAPELKWPDLHPVKGVVRVGGKPAAGGFIHFRPEDPAAGTNFVVTSDVGADGSFTLATGNAQDAREDRRRPGAPAGKYVVTFSPPQGDQVAGRPALPIQGAQPVTVAAGENNLTIDLPGKK